jgi:quinol monooxygenase YgiN
MKNQVSWILELRVREGRESDLRALMAEMVAATEANEPGTLSYEWSASADGRACHVYERYTDSAAVMTHLVTFGERFAPRFEQVLEPVRTVVYGSPSEAVKNALADLNPTYMELVAGFNR